MNPNFNPDDNALKDKIITLSGSSGGMLVGNRHSSNGIKAINKSTGRPIEMEGGEVVITRNAVSDNELREFNGQMLTNRQILSKINESGGGISFAEEGAELPTEINCCGNSYEYGGRTQTDFDIINEIYSYKYDEDKNTISYFFGSIYDTAKIFCSDLECDGTTKIISHFLDTNNYPHQVFMGMIHKIKDGEIIESFYPHQWIKINVNHNIYIIDFKSKMWMGEDAPEGIIDVSSLTDFAYEGEEIILDPINKMIMYHIQSQNL